MHHRKQSEEPGQKGSDRMQRKNVYSVRQVNTYIKNMFMQDYMLNRIYVKGEVSNCKYHTSGHVYFSLKDESGTIACVMFAGDRSGLTFRMQEGQQVIVLGRVNVYERDGRYQLYAKEIIQDGAGLLNEKFEALKKELEEMGMFAEEYKRPIPSYPKKVGIVTAPTGAAVRDIINIASRRNPFVQLILYPALVQGEGAASSIVQGIQMLEAKGVDVIIAGRGGGSMEDLWAFNEETVAKAIFDCGIPVISAVGHETDTTIADYVADLRAPTPSAAAELAVPEYHLIEARLDESERQLRQRMRSVIQISRKELEQFRIQLGYRHPRQQLAQKRQFVAEEEETLRRLMRQILDKRTHQLKIYVEKMKGLSPLTKLEHGFSYMENERGKNIRSVEHVGKGEMLSVFVTDGRIQAEVKDVIKEDIHGYKK